MQITEISQYERIIWIHKYLKKCRLSYSDFYDQFSRSKRTFLRDLNTLEIFFNAPIKDQNGSYYYDDKTFDLPQMTISQKELVGLFISTSLNQEYKNTPIYSSIKKIVKKLQESSSSSIDPLKLSIGHLKKKEMKLDWDIFYTIAKAVIEQKTIVIEYSSFNSSTESKRGIDPYHLYVYEDEFYVAAFCHNRNEIRDFNLNRIKSINCTSKSFDNSSFNLENYFNQKSWGIIKGESIKKVVLKVSLHEANKIIEDFPSKFIEISRDDRYIIYELYTDITNEFVNWILTKQSFIVVSEPNELKEKIKGICEEILKEYEGDM